jgi:hypothetical protein
MLLMLVIVDAESATNFKEVSKVNTVIAVTPSKTVVSPGEVFTVTVSIVPAVAVAGAQFDLAYNPQAVQITKIDEGEVFKAGGAQSYFMPGTIDNINGTVKAVVDVMVGPGKETSVTGIMATLTCKAVTAGKTSMFVLSKVIVGNKDGVAVPLDSFSIIQTQVASSTDLNLDGVVDMADVLMIVAVFGTVGTPPDNREDLNSDGEVNVLDLILLGQSWS